MFPNLEDNKKPNQHDDHLHTSKQARRNNRRKHNQPSTLSSSLANKNNNPQADEVVSNKNNQHNQKDEVPSTECVPFSNESIRSKTSLNNYTDSDDDNGRVPIKPWSPVPADSEVPSSSFGANTNGQDAMTPSSPAYTLAIRELFEMITEDLDRFVYTPAPNGLGDIQCRITRDKRGMEKGLFPTYYMHVERPGDGKKVIVN